MIAPLAAIALVLLNVHLIPDITNSMRLLGNTVGGVSLFASGILLQAMAPPFSPAAAVSTVGRLVLVPGAVYLALTYLGVDHDLRRMSVLAMGLAAGPIQVILAGRYKKAEKENAAALLYTSFACIPTLAFLSG